MATCPQCNTQVTPGEAFCDNCGASLAGAAVQPMAQPVAPAPMAGGATCIHCGTAVTPGAAFCDNCGQPVTAGPAPMQQPVQPIVPMQQPMAPAPMAPIAAVQAGRCGSCGASNPPGQAFCDNCGASLGGQPVAQPVAPFVPMAPQPVPGMRPRLVAANGAQFDLTGKNQAIIGREDPVSGVFPDVDLTPHGGDAGGVSRRHAKLAFNGYQWAVEDLNSTNFTFVNNQKVNPGVPQPLNNGDQVRLGKVVLTFQTM